MSSGAKKQKNKKNKHNKKDKDTGNHTFSPALPEWSSEVKGHIEQQLKKYKYFRKRPHVYPCDNFEPFVNKTISTLDKKKGDFCWSLDWDPIFFSQLIYNGFLTIASEIQDNIYVMLPKLHQERCIIDLNKALIISKSTKKKSKNYTITVNQCFEKVFQNCINQHGLNWLYPPMQAVLYAIFHNKNDPQLNGVTAHSIEIWNSNNELIAGELGTSVGSIYTSLTGFYIQSGAGSIQLLALAHLLKKVNFKLWDLGMFIEYKASLGAVLLKRKEFIKKYKSLRDDKNVKLECEEKINCRDIVNEVINVSNNVEMKEEKSNNKIRNENKVLSKKAQKRLAKKEKRRLAKLKANKLQEEKKENNEVEIDEYKYIKKGLGENCGDNWRDYMNNFKSEEVKDLDLCLLSVDDWKQLIPQNEPRMKFRLWMVNKMIELTHRHEIQWNNLSKIRI